MTNAQILLALQGICPECGGGGWVIEKRPPQGEYKIERRITCPTCHGTGKVEFETLCCNVDPPYMPFMRMLCRIFEDRNGCYPAPMADLAFALMEERAKRSDGTEKSMSAHGALGLIGTARIMEAHLGPALAFDDITVRLIDKIVAACLMELNSQKKMWSNNMPGPCSDSYDPEWSTVDNADRIREALLDMHKKLTSVLGDTPPIFILSLLESEFNNTMTVMLTEKEWRILRFACERAKESI